MTSGWARFQTSGGSPNWRPLAKSIVPIAPSATIGPARVEERAELRVRGAAVDRATGLDVREGLPVDGLEDRDGRVAVARAVRSARGGLVQSPGPGAASYAVHGRHHPITGTVASGPAHAPCPRIGPVP